MTSENQPLSYKSAGVDIEAGDALVEKIKPFVKRTHRKEWLGGIGGFGALFEIPLDRYKNPVLVSGTDGVGTKLKLAQMLNNHTTIGIDLVAMCVNDILAQGAEPLFFLDYYATGKLDTQAAATVIKGIARGCEISGMSLIGGETAEMPGMYAGDDYDLAGFCVGIIEKQKIITGETIQPGDSIIALASSGPHSNGYSLIRKILEVSGADVDMPMAVTADEKSSSESSTGTSLGDALIEPTRIYTKSVLNLIETVNVKGIAHITGGGITGNLVRILPPNTKASVNLNSWEFTEVFKWISKTGNLDQQEMFKTFNCGIGLMLVVEKADTDKTIERLNQSGEKAWLAGTVEVLDAKMPIVELNG